MASCGFSGNSDMYGLGIRLGFYLNWYGSTLASWIARDEYDGMELSNSFFVAATFLALVIQVARDNLKTVEIYIVLLLCFGGYLYLVPLYIWRILTCWEAKYDPSRWSRVPVGFMFSTLNWILLVAVAVFQLYFWISKVPGTVVDQCEEFGFLFTKVNLASKGSIAVNILLYFFLLLFSAGSLCYSVIKSWSSKQEEKKKKKKKRRPKIPGRVRILVLQQMHTLISLGVASTIVAATELTITWNGIEDVKDITSAGQTIPLVIAIGLIVRVIYVAMFIGDDDPHKYDFHRPRHPRPGDGTHPDDSTQRRQPEDGSRLPPRRPIRRQPDDEGYLPRRDHDVEETGRLPRRIEPE